MTQEQEAQMTMLMRVLEVFRKYPDQIDEAPELREQVDVLKDTAKKIFDEITDEERDTLLERYKEEMKWLQNNS